MDNSILINCDLGEIDPTLKLEEAVMPLIDLCNIACGGHAGTERMMIGTIKLAKKHKVKIGAHPSFPDKENFGRKVMSFSSEELMHLINHQILLLKEHCDNLEAEMNHVKAHGALYHFLASKEKEAGGFVKLIKQIDPTLAIIGPPNSELERICKSKGMVFLKESFGDRTYNQELKLVDRSIQGSVHENIEKAFTQVELLMKEAKVMVLGELLTLKSDTLCIHGDSKIALDLLDSIQSLRTNGTID